MIKSLSELRARRGASDPKDGGKQKNDWAFEAGMAAMGWTSLAMAVTYIVNGSWLGGGLGLIGGFIGLCLVFVVSAGAASVGWAKRADIVGYVVVLIALGLFSRGRWETVPWLPLAAAIVSWPFHAVRYRREQLAEAATPTEELPRDVADTLVSLPADLEPRLRAPLDRALQDCAALQTAAKAAHGDTSMEGAFRLFGIDPAALVDDAHATLREMGRRAINGQALAQALAEGASSKVGEALDACVTTLEAQADEIRGAREAWLLFHVAQASERAGRVEGLRRRAEALRATGEAIREVERAVKL